MNKKFLTSAMALVLALGTTTLAACGGEVEQQIDTSKTQIYVSVYNGGTGVAWIKPMAEEFNATNDKYQIVISEEKLSSVDILNQIDSGATGKTVPSVYFTGEVIYQSLIYKDKLEDLSDLTSRTLEGESGTLLDKIGASEDYYETVWKSVSSKNGSGIYMLPYCDSFGGLIFDYNSFLVEGFLNYADASSEDVKAALTAQKISYEVEGAKLKFTSYAGSDIYFNYKEGDYILTAGKDGVYGSYDDGQPTTIAEWDSMFAKIKGKNKKPLIWTDQYNGYVDMVTEAMMAQYSGLEEFNTYFSFDGTVTVDGEKKTVTPENGYEVYGMDGFGKSVNFINTYFNNSQNAHTSVELDTSHTEAQMQYLLSFNTDEEAMMIVEGEWFENEARAAFKTDTLVNNGRGYGEREYRFMLLPTLEGSYGLDGNGNGSVLSVLNSGAILVPKCADANKLAAIKDFIAYTLTDKNLARFTMETGIANAYDYSLTADQLKGLTPFARNVFQMYHDTENVGFARAYLLYAGQPMRYATSGGFFKHRILFADGAAQFDSLMKALGTKDMTVEKLINGAKNYYSHEGHKGQYTASTWETMLTEAKSSGFYK